jgi:hypothetical protein
MVVSWFELSDAVSMIYAAQAGGWLGGGNLGHRMHVGGGLPRPHSVPAANRSSSPLLLPLRRRLLHDRRYFQGGHYEGERRVSMTEISRTWHSNKLGVVVGCRVGSIWVVLMNEVHVF